MPLYIAKSGDLDRCYRCLTHSHLKDRATQLLIKYKSGALVTQYQTMRVDEHLQVDKKTRSSGHRQGEQEDNVLSCEI